MNDTKLHINWYPGHMTKTRRALEDKLKLIDLVIEILDARAPLSSQNPDFDDLFAGKRRMLVLNKADMADERITKRWLEYFRGQGSMLSHIRLSGEIRGSCKGKSRIVPGPSMRSMPQRDGRKPCGRWCAASPMWANRQF